MRSQALAVSLALLIIAMAMLPGISFSLSSSVTSNFNTIQYVDDSSSLGLYKDSEGKTPWTSSEFGPTNICAFKQETGYMIKESTWAMGSSAVYLIVKGELDEYSLSFSLNIPGTLGSTQYPSSVSVSLIKGNEKMDWDSGNPDKTLTISKDIVYEVVVNFHYSEDRILSASSLDSLRFNWGIRFSLDTGASVLSSGNQASFNEVKQSMGGIYIDNGSLVSKDGGYYVTSGQGGYDFGTKGGMTVGINTDGTISFKIQITISTNGNNGAVLTLKVSDSTGVTEIPVDCSKKTTSVQYLGSENQLKNNISEVSPFTGSVSISLYGLKPNSGMTMQVKLIPVTS